MKPRIRLLRNVWDCMLPDGRRNRIVGFGSTPSEAYMDWVRQMVQQGQMRLKGLM